MKVVTARSDRFLGVLPNLSTKVLRSLPINSSSVVAPLLSFSEGTCVAAGAVDGTVLLFDLSRPPPNTVANKLLGHARPVTAVAFSSGERFLASADAAGQIIVWKK